MSHPSEYPLNVKPGNEPEARAKAAAEQRRRVCLRCRNKFLSAGIHNRVCKVCKDSPDWRSGVA